MGKKNDDVLSMESLGVVKKPSGNNRNLQLRDLVREGATDLFPEYIQSMMMLRQDGYHKDFCDQYAKMLKFVLPTISAIQFQEGKNASDAVQLMQIAALYLSGQGVQSATPLSLTRKDEVQDE